MSPTSKRRAPSRWSIDLEAATAADIAAHLQDADAVVFAAGAGPGSGAARKQTVDRDAAILLADAAEAAGVRRYVMISAIGADVEAPDDIGDPVFVAYLRAKGAADDAIRAREGTRRHRRASRASHERRRHRTGGDLRPNRAW